MQRSLVAGRSLPDRGVKLWGGTWSQPTVAETARSLGRRLAVTASGQATVGLPSAPVSNRATATMFSVEGRKGTGREGARFLEELLWLFGAKFGPSPFGASLSACPS